MSAFNDAFNFVLHFASYLVYVFLTVDVELHDNRKLDLFNFYSSFRHTEINKDFINLMMLKTVGCGLLKFLVPKVKIISSKTLHYDVIIAGGGVMGSSTAYFLKHKNPDLNIAVVERDLSYADSASALSVASIRQQFSTIENISLSQWSFKFMVDIRRSLTVDESNPADVQLFRSSYMFLASELGHNILKQNCELQVSCGADIQFLSPLKLKERFDWLNVSGLSAGSICNDKHEGWFDGWSLLFAFQKKALSLGVEYINGNCEIVDIGSKVNGVEIKTNEGRHYINCSYFVNAAGPWAGDLMGKVGVHLPVCPRKRYVFTFDCAKGPGRGMPLSVDPSGVYCRPEGHGTLYLCGCSPNEEDEPDISNLDVDYDYFDEFIWPILAERYEGMEELKLRHSWAGYYDYNTFDQNGIIGGHPEIYNLFFANGFSGHGIQQSPAVGNAISELILDKQFTDIDLTRLNYQRILDNKQIQEINVV